MSSSLLNNILGFLLAVLVANCGVDNYSEINENCIKATEVSDGEYKSDPQTLDPKFPLAPKQSEVSMKIDKANKSVEISYNDDGKKTVQKWRIR